MPSTDRNPWLNRFIWFTALATLLLICSGGMVTSKGVGLAVPDWPTTFGYNMFLFPVSKWVGGVFFEHTHRLIASVVGLLTILLSVWLWVDDDRRWVQRLGFFALGGVILQGVLGGLRVTLLKNEIGIFHACLAQAFLGLIVFIAVVRTETWRALPAPGSLVLSRFRPLFLLVLATTVAIYLQLALGATMRHQHCDLSILDFPTANGSWLPDTSAAKVAAINMQREKLGLSEVTAFQIWLQMAHRFGALIILSGVVACASRIWSDGPGVRILRRLSVIWTGLLAVQLMLGAWTIWSNKAADVATAHVAVGAAMLSFGVSICAITGRLLCASRAVSMSGPSLEKRGVAIA